ncbi:hypothetical protein BME99_31125 [Pseudomonas protegens]|nr:hypothetical protein BME99_31125 [Pseudomonas protegens]
MNLFTDAIGIRGLCLALVLLAGVPVAQAFDLSKIRWWEMQSDILLDDPETATLQLEPFPLPGLAQAPARVILSQYQGLFYLNGYADGQYRQRVYKSPPLPLFDAQALQVCVPEQRPVEATDNWPPSKQLEAALSLTKLSFDCQSPGWELSNRYLLVDSRDPQRQLLAIGQRQGEARIDFTPQQPTSPELQQQWLQALQKYPKLLEPFDASSGQLSVKPYAPPPSAEQVWTEFRQLHTQLRDAKDKAPGIARVEEFFSRQDFRAIAPERSTYRACSTTSPIGPPRPASCRAPAPGWRTCCVATRGACRPTSIWRTWIGACTNSSPRTPGTGAGPWRTIGCIAGCACNANLGSPPGSPNAWALRHPANRPAKAPGRW